MKSLAVLGMAILLLASFFQCCPSSSSEEPSVQPPTEQAATPPTESRPEEPTAPPAEHVWTLVAPEGFTHGLFPVDCLTDESCWDCVIRDLPGGTQLAPGPEGCQAADWDPSYVYCHVQVMSGEYQGQWGWVNEKFIDK